MDIIELLGVAVKRNASDVQILALTAPVMRIDGKLETVDSAPLTPDTVKQIFEEITTNEQREAFERELELDFAYTFSRGIRFRVNACREKGSIGLAFRLVRNSIPTIEELGLPPVCQELVTKPHGLVMVTGPTGSGKSTTLASMIEFLNHHHRRHVVTIEDPIEFEYRSDQCLIRQREVGFDTHSFAAALKHVLRQDPDVILVGEMRDLETASTVLTVAETGHLVLSTGHAPSAHLSIERIIDIFPAHQQQLSLGRLAAVLEGVLCQTLIPRIDGSGRVPAVEVMLATQAVKHLIRENKAYQLPNVIRTSSQQGMCTMDEAIASLYLKKLISKKEAFARCEDEEDFAKIVGEPRRAVYAGGRH